MILVNTSLHKNVGNCRRYCKRQFSKLLKDIATKGMHENFGVNTVRRCLEYVHKQKLDSVLSYSDYYDWIVDDLNFCVSVLTDILTSHRDSKFEHAEAFVHEYVFFEDFDFVKYEY